ncbi:MAG: CotH kinase family protein [Hyphomicrobiales bacterium]|nr:CotH kinase family protein [Hyphomicrobiales bacterium]
MRSASPAFRQTPQQRYERLKLYFAYFLLLLITLIATAYHYYGTSDTVVEYIPPSGIRETIHLDIGFNDFVVLWMKHEEAVKKTVLFRSEEDFVPAKIRHGNTIIPVRVRLKGDLMDHMNKKNFWSLRVEVQGDHALFGMRNFSLQPPQTRNNHLEPLFHKHLQSEGILTPRYRFVNLYLNDAYVGVIAMEEHFSKEMLESMQRKDSIIVGFDETDFWKDRLRNRFDPIRHNYYHDLINWRVAPVNMINHRAVSRKSPLRPLSDDLLRVWRGNIRRHRYWTLIKWDVIWLFLSYGKPSITSVYEPAVST